MGNKPLKSESVVKSKQSKMIIPANTSNKNSNNTNTNTNKANVNKENQKQEVELTFMNTQPDINQIQNIPNPKTYKDYLSKGNYLFQVRNWNESYFNYSKAIDLNKKKSHSYIEATYGSIRCLVMMNKIQEAKDEFSKLTNEFPKDTSIIINNGLFYIDINEPNKSIELFDRGIEFEPNYALIHCYKAMALVKIHCLNEALSCLDKAIENEEFNLPFYVRKALLLTQMGLKDQSINAMTKIENIIIENKEKRIYDKKEIAKARNAIKTIKIFNAVPMFDGNYSTSNTNVENEVVLSNNIPKSNNMNKKDKDSKCTDDVNIIKDKEIESKNNDNVKHLDKEKSSDIDKSQDIDKNKEQINNEIRMITNSKKKEDYSIDLPIINEEKSQNNSDALKERKQTNPSQFAHELQINDNNNNNDNDNYNYNDNSINEPKIENEIEESKAIKIKPQTNIEEEGKEDPESIVKEIQITKSSNDNDQLTKQPNQESFQTKEIKKTEACLIEIISYQTKQSSFVCKKTYTLTTLSLSTESKEDIFNKLNEKLQRCSKNVNFPIIYSSIFNIEKDSIEIIEDYCDEGDLLSFLKQTYLMFTEKIDIIGRLLDSLAFLIINEIPFDFNLKHLLVININNSHLVKITLSSIKPIINPNEISIISKESLYALFKEILAINNQNSNYENQLNELLDSKFNAESNLDLIEIIAELISVFDPSKFLDE